MKKILFMGAMAAMLLGTASCSNEVDQPAMGDEVNAAFSVSMDGIESRAISDGLTVNELYFEVYEAKTESATTTYTKLPSLSQKVAVASKTATVTTKLIKGKTYKFNDENRDAFFANVEKKVEEAFEQDVTLYRPFAQINFGASDVDASMDISGFTSQLVVKNVPNQFNVLSGEASGDQAEVTLAATAVPARIPETLTVDGKDYTYISMNYILATPEKATKDITLKVMDGTTEVKVLPVSACPMQRNYRTNILGDILSVEGKFNITIDPIYAGDLEVLPEPWDGSIEDPVVDGNNVTINNAAQLAGLARDVNSGNTYAGKTVTLTADLNLDNKPWTPIGNVHAYPGQAFHGIFDGQGHTIYNMSCNNEYPEHSTAALFGSISEGTIMNLIIKNATIISKHYAAAVCGYKGDSKSSTISNCSAINCSITSTAETVKGELDNGDKVGGIIGYAANPTIIKNCTVDGCTISAVRDCAGIAGYLGDASNFTGNKVINTSVTANQKNQYAYHPEAYGYVGVFRGRQGDTGLDASNTKSNVTLIFISTDGDETNVQQ